MNAFTDQVLYGLEACFPRRCLVCSEHAQGQVVCRWCLPTELYKTDSQICKICCAKTYSHSNICNLCTLYPLYFSSLRSLWLYESEAKILLRKCKYGPSYSLAKFCADQFAKHFHELSTKVSWDYIVPVPSHLSNLKERFFDLSYLLAKAISKKTKIPILSRTIHHKKNRAVQASLSATKRFENIAKGYQLKNTSKLIKKKVLLVDDVVTTGATISILTSSLLQQKVKQIDVTCLALSPFFSQYRYALHKFVTSKQITVRVTDSRYTSSD